MRKTLIVAAVAFLVGFGARMLLEPEPELSSGSPAAPGTARSGGPSQRQPAAREEAEVREPEGPGVRPARIGREGAPAAPAASLTPAQLVLENARLRSELVELQRQAEGDRKVSELERGSPLPAPEQLDKRFSQDSLRSSLSAALTEAGLPASITSVDCTEYPCMIYGDGKGGPGEFERLFATEAMRAYVSDTHNAFGWSTGDGSQEHPRRDFLGLAIYPADDAKVRGAELRRRLKYRSAQMAETFDGN